nr:MAG TPA: hypothetical protein [Caudoviricetes sp.]
MITPLFFRDFVRQSRSGIFADFRKDFTLESLVKTGNNSSFPFLHRETFHREFFLSANRLRHKLQPVRFFCFRRKRFSAHQL